MTSFVKPESVDGGVHVQTVYTDVVIDDTPYEPQTRDEERDLLDLAQFGQLEVVDDAPTSFSPTPAEPEPVEAEVSDESNEFTGDFS